MSKPVIAFAVGGVVEMLDEQTGELVAYDPAGNEAAVARLAAAFVRYARDPGLRVRQGVSGRARVLLDFDARAHATRIEREIVVAARVAPQPTRPGPGGR